MQALRKNLLKHSGLMTAMLALFLLHSILLQAHVHREALAATQAKSVASLPGGDGPQPLLAKHALDCLSCQLLSHGSAPLAPGASTLRVQVATAVRVAAASNVTAILSRPAHDWQSRGPPVLS